MIHESVEWNVASDMGERAVGMSAVLEVILSPHTRMSLKESLPHIIIRPWKKPYRTHSYVFEAYLIDCSTVWILLSNKEAAIFLSYEIKPWKDRWQCVLQLFCWYCYKGELSPIHIVCSSLQQALRLLSPLSPHQSSGTVFQLRTFPFHSQSNPWPPSPTQHTNPIWTSDQMWETQATVRPNTVRIMIGYGER